MELWIRTQDRAKLLIVKELELQKVAHQKLAIIWGGTKDNYRSLGKYSTEERAMQVMDEIENFITIRMKNTGTYEENDLLIKSEIVKNQIKIFEMPEE